MQVLHQIPILNSRSTLQRLSFSTKASNLLTYKKNNLYFEKVKTRKFFKKPNLQQKQFSGRRLSFKQLLKKFVFKKKTKKFGWYKNKRPFWRQKFYLRTRRYSNFLLPLASHIRGVAPSEVNFQDINERHLWTYNIKYRRARFAFRNKIYMRKTFLRRYGFKNKTQLKNYQLKVYKTSRPLDTCFQVLEGRFGRIAIRLGWLRSFRLAVRVVRFGGFYINGGVFKNPNVCIVRNDVLSIRKKKFIKAVMLAKKFNKFRKPKFRLPIVSSVSWRYLRSPLNSIYKFKFQKLKEFRVLRLKPSRQRFRRKLKHKRLSKLLHKRLRFYKCLFTTMHSCSQITKTVLPLVEKFFFLVAVQSFIAPRFASLACARSTFFDIGVGVFLDKRALRIYHFSFLLRFISCYCIHDFNFIAAFVAFWYFDDMLGSPRTLFVFYFLVRTLLLLSRWFSANPHYFMFYRLSEPAAFFEATTAFRFYAGSSQTCFSYTCTLRHSLLFVVLNILPLVGLLPGFTKFSFVYKRLVFSVLKKKYFKKKYKKVVARPVLTPIKKRYRQNKKFSGKRFAGGRKRRKLRFKHSKFAYYRRRIPWRSIKIAMRYVGLRNKLLHPFTTSVFLKNTFVLYNELFLKKLFLKKKLFLRRTRRLFSPNFFKFFAAKSRSNDKLFFIRSVYRLAARHVFTNFKKKTAIRPSNKQFEFSKRKACFVLTNKFRFSTFAWLKSANVLQLNRRVFDTFSNQKLY